MPIICLATKIFLFNTLLLKKYDYMHTIISKLKNSFKFNILFLSGILILDIIFGLSWISFTNKINSNTFHIELWMYFLYFAGGIFPCYIFNILFTKQK